jgi:O-methyltransferase
VNKKLARLFIDRVYFRTRVLQILYRRHFARYVSPWIRTPPYSDVCKKLVANSGDPVRYSAIALALERIKREKVPGALAEVGVFQGDLSSFLTALMGDRTLYLFDTFAGFPEQDLEGEEKRFDSTSIELVKKRVNGNAVFRKGHFPDTATGLEAEKFAFVSLDPDLYKPIVAGLRFFWPRLSPGGYIFIHDFYTGDTVARAVQDCGVTDFVELPDKWGSIIMRKTTAPVQSSLTLSS